MIMKNKNNKKMVLATGFTIFTLLTTMCATFAWFLVPKPNVSLDTVSGDMSISLKKLSAYRYVYPFYKDSNSYIDYSVDSSGKDKGKLKKFVIKDNDEIKPLDSIPKIDVPSSFTKTALYLVGDSIYLGDTSLTEFSLSSGLIFSSSTSALEFTISSANLSIGSHFTVARNDGTIVSFSSTSLNAEEIEYTNNHFTCKKAGLYDFKITKSTTSSDATYSIEITSKSRSDESILGMTLFDPTYALLNGNNNDLKGRSNAIYEQNTCLIYDIEIAVINQTRNFSLSLDVKRKALDNDEGKIGDSSYKLSKYVTYRFKEHEENDTVDSLFTSTFHKYDNSDANAIYNYPDNIQNDGDSSNNSSSSSNISSNSDETNTSTESNISVLAFNSKDTTSLSLLKDKKPTSYNSNQTEFHFYIAVDYSPVAIEYFFKENQLSKIYDLERDYTFYFSSIQQVNNSTTTDGGNN